MPDILTNKQTKDYQKVSRYSSLPFYYNIIDEKYFYGIGTHLSTSTSYKLHKVINGDTLDSIALYYYNNPTYYWIIADFNRIRDPFEPLIVGQKLKIPTFSCIEFEA